MPTADADGYGTARVLRATERGLDLSLTAGAAWVVPASQREVERLTGSSCTVRVNTVSVEF